MSREAEIAFSNIVSDKSRSNLEALSPDPRAFCNDIENGGGATSDVAIIFARGTTEIGNVGINTGPPFFAAVATKLHGLSIAFQGVKYPAIYIDMFKWGAVGSDVMVEHVRTARKRNPNIKIVLSGYSQGALVVRAATKLLTDVERTSVKCMVLFGDPAYTDEVPEYSMTNVLEVCDPEDGVCRGNVGNDLDYSVEKTVIAHASYRKDAGAAADFVAKALGV